MKLKSGWRVERLGDLAAADDGAIAIGPFGSSMKADVYRSQGVPLVRGTNLDGNPGFQGEFVFVGEDVASKFHRCLILPGDLVFPHRGSIGSVGFAVDQPPGRWLLSTSMMKFRADPQRLDAAYAFHFFRSERGRYELLKNASQVGTPGIGQPLTSLRACEIPLPPTIYEQREIAAVLSTLDEKIEKNKKTVKVLEDLARAIFRSWFVDFEPIRAKAAGAASFPSIPQSVFDGLPLGLVDSKAGLIADGWRPGKIGDIAEEKREVVHPSSIEARTPYIGLEHMPRRSVALSDWGESGQVTSHKVRFSRGDILFGKLRPYFHKVGVAALDGVCSTDIVVIQPSSPSWFGFLLGAVSSSDFVAHTASYSEGTKMPRTNWRDMASYAVCLPPESVASAFNEIIRPIVEKINSNTFETKKLLDIRDYLLPRLISGKVSFKAVEKEA